MRPSSIRSYRDKVQTLSATFPDTNDSAPITPAMAEECKIRRAKAGKSPHTIRGDLNNLSRVYRKWWIGACRLLSENPFEHVHSPKAEKLEPRRITLEERSAFLDWLSARWDGWRLPMLFLEVKGAIGCRIAELASAPTPALAGGRITFTAETVKERKTRRSKLPPPLSDELTSIVGGTYL